MTRPPLDFAASLNPLGPPPGAVEAARTALDRLDRGPEPGCPRLTERLAERHGVPVDRVFVAAGATAVMSLIGQSLREVLALHAEELGDPGMALSHLVEPTSPAYRRISALNDLRIEVWSKHVLGWDQHFLPRSAAGIYWTGHPNNPTGRAWDRDALVALVDDTQALLTVVDEVYQPFLADEADRTLTGAVASRDNLLVVRSFSKQYAMPGLRIGYAVASPDMVVRLRQFQDPWTVTAAAEAAALAALEARDYGERTAAFVASEAARVMERLWDLPGVRPVWPSRDRPDPTPPYPNFLLVSLTETAWNSVQARDELGRRGFLVRECSDFPGLEIGTLLTGPDQLVATLGHLRIALRTPAENDLLLDQLREILASEPPR